MGSGGEGGTIIAARHAPEYTGGWEYRVRWKGGCADTWESETQFVRCAQPSPAVRAEMNRVQVHAREPSSLYEALQDDAARLPRAWGDRMQLALYGDASKAHVQGAFEELLLYFDKYARAAGSKQAAIDNIEELTEMQGAGPGWADKVEPWQTLYRGKLEPVIDSDGEIERKEDGRPKMRQRMGLDARTAWEMSRPTEYIIGEATASERVAEDEQREAAGATGEQYESTLPLTRPHEQVYIDGKNVGQWRKVSRHTALGDEAIRADAVLRLMARYDELEMTDGGAGLTTKYGVKVSMDKNERQVMARSGDTTTAQAMTVALALHLYHHFTDAAATDGSADRVRRVGGGWRARASYGVYEGVQPGEWKGKDAEQDAVRAGMWGGALPEGWDNNDAEALAILAYLRSVAARPGASERRVLVMSDSDGVLQQIEAAWRAGPRKCRRQDRGCMIEAICNTRKELGRVVFMWVPGHGGCAPNSVADAIAKAHIDEVPGAEVSAGVLEGVKSRACAYGVKKRDDAGGEQVVLRDRRTYRAVRQEGRAHVCRRLAQGLTPGGLMVDPSLVGVGTRAADDGWWEEVAAATGKWRLDERDGAAAIRRGNERRELVFGVRAGELRGVAHGRASERRRAAEGEKGGWETRSRVRGCMVCSTGREAEAGVCTQCEGWVGRRTRRQCCEVSAKEQGLWPTPKLRLAAQPHGARETVAERLRRVGEHHVQCAESATLATLAHVFTCECTALGGKQGTPATELRELIARVGEAVPRSESSGAGSRYHAHVEAAMRAMGAPGHGAVGVGGQHRALRG